MIIISQDEIKITESLELNVKEVKTCKNILIPRDEYKKFQKITQKNGNWISEKELKGLGEFLGQETTKSVYAITEIKTNRIFGIYSTKEKARKVLKEIIQKNEKSKNYQMLKDEGIGISIL